MRETVYVHVVLVVVNVIHILGQFGAFLITYCSVPHWWCVRHGPDSAVSESKSKGKERHFAKKKKKIESVRNHALSSSHPVHPSNMLPIPGQRIV